MAQAKKILTSAPEVKQKAEGGFLSVTGASDGRTYNARTMSTPGTGLLPNYPVLFRSNATGSPVLASERGSEYFVSSSDLANPAIANQIYSTVRALKVDFTFAVGGLKNHELYFSILGGDGKPAGRVAQQIDKDFGSFDNYKKDLKATGIAARSYYGTTIATSASSQIEATALLVATGIERPNGIMLSPDEKTLYVNNTSGEYMVAFDVAADGTTSNRRNFARYASVTRNDAGAVNSGADGLAVDAEGRIYCAAIGGVQVFSPKGEHLGTIPVSLQPQNIAFAGADRKTLFIVGRGAAFRVRVLTPGFAGRAK